MSKRSLTAALASGLAACVIAYPAARQGISLLDDGLWLLGSRMLADGGVLYRDLFSIYGPAKFVLLLPFFGVMGTSATALAALKAMTVGVAAGLGTSIATRRAGWWMAIIPIIGALALWATRPRYVAAGAFALATAACLERRSGPRVFALLGLGWAVVATFGFDAAGYATVILAGTIILTPRRRPGATQLTALGLGALGGLGALAMVAVATGSFRPAVWDTIIYPLTRFGAEMGLSPLDLFRNGDSAGVLFLDHQTGEAHAEAWAGHQAMLVIARRLLFVGLLALPLLGAFLARKRGDDPLLASLTAFAFAGWSTAAVRGEPGHLAAGWLGCLWLLPLLPATLASSGRNVWRFLTMALALIVLLPLAAEPVWLTLNADRPGLAEWKRPEAGILLTTERIQGLEELERRLDELASGPMLFWPSRPGLNFFFGTPVGSPQATLLGGEVRDPNAVLADIAAHPAHAVLFHPPHRSDRRGNRDVAPEIWAGLRRTHRVAGYIAGTIDEFVVLVPAPSGVDATDLPLHVRLHDQRQSIADAVSPVLRPDLAVGQALRVGLAPLSGLVVRPAVGAGTLLSLEILVRALDEGTPGHELGCYNLNLTLAAGQDPVMLPFGPVPGSAGRGVLVELRAIESTSSEVRLLWHEQAGVAPHDAAWVGGRATPASLYFLSY